jgi:hypothetical protein
MSRKFCRDREALVKKTRVKRRSIFVVNAIRNPEKKNGAANRRK